MIQLPVDPADQYIEQGDDAPFTVSFSIESMRRAYRMGVIIGRLQKLGLSEQTIGEVEQAIFKDLDILKS